MKAEANKSTGADGESVKGIAQGIKGIVDAAKSGGVELKDTAEGDALNADAGKLFLVKNGNANNNGGAAADAEKAADTGKKAGVTTNPIGAAIGANDDGNGAAFGNSMNKDAQIAAAITLRGMAKGGKFALKSNAAAEKALKSTVESARDYKRD